MHHLLRIFVVCSLAASIYGAIIRVIPASQSRRIFVQRQRPVQRSILGYGSTFASISDADTVNLGSRFGSSLLRGRSSGGGVLVYGGDSPDIYNPYENLGDTPDFYPIIQSGGFGRAGGLGLNSLQLAQLYGGDTPDNAIFFG